MAKTTFKIDGLFIIGSLVAVAGIVTYSKWGDIKKSAQAVNPASEENLIYKGLSNVVENSTQGESKTLGEYWFNKCGESGFKSWYCPNV